MALFEFEGDTLLVGTVREVDTRKVAIHVRTDADLRKAKVGQLVCLQVASAVETWLIGLVDKVIKSVTIATNTEDSGDETTELEGAVEDVINTVRLTLLGTARWDAVKQ